jgi:DNA-binding NtrC family response regulator
MADRRRSAWDEETVDPAEHSRRGDLALLVVHGADVAVHPLPRTGVLRIGRGSVNDVVISHATVSRQHCVLNLGPEITVVDAPGSTSGVRVRGQRIVPGEPAAIEIGEAFALGDVLAIVQHRVDAETAAQSEIRADTATLAARLGDTVIRDPQMVQLYELVARLAPGAIHVLVHGETGVGKERVAEALHRLSPRADKPLLRLNCASFTGPLLESELFGHEKGAFTGAVVAKPGLIESANGGTVLLDEVAEMPLETQARLLRVIEDRSVLRVGAVRPRTVDVRFVSATHRDLRERVATGAFRQDLYFRLNGAVLEVPPLRDRPTEVEPLIERFARAAGRSLDDFDSAARSVLLRYGWPGNVRELRNVVERALLLAGSSRINPEHLPRELRDHAAAPASDRTARELAPSSDERARILEALERTHGNQTKAAELLGMPRRTFNKRLMEYKIPGPRGGRSD